MIHLRGIPQARITVMRRPAGLVTSLAATERLHHCALLVLTAYKPKVHNLEDLGKRAGDLPPALRNIFPRGNPEDDRLFKLLKHAYVDARYDPRFTITREELATLAGHLRVLRARVEQVCQERIAAMR